MQPLPLLIGGLGCLIGLALLLWQTPSVQDESHRAQESDMDSEDF